MVAAKPLDPIAAWGNIETPYSQESEEAAIGAVITDGARFPKCLAIAAPDSFFILRHRYIWQALKDLNDRGEPIDYLTITQQLKDNGRLSEIGGPAYITQLINNTPTSVHAEVYTDMVQRAWLRRNKMSIADQIKAIALDQTLTVEQVEDRIAELMETAPRLNRRKQAKSMKDVMSVIYDDYVDRVYNKVSTLGISTGYNGLDYILGGWQKKRLHYIGGRPGMGKSAFLMEMANRVAMQTKPDGSPYNVLFVSLEMSAEELGARLLTNATSLNSHRILDTNMGYDDRQKMVKSMGDLSNRSIYIEDDSTDLTPKRLLEMCLDFKSDHHGVLDMLCLDYFQLMTPPIVRKGGTEASELSAISRQLKTISRKLNIPLMVAAQLGQQLDRRPIDKRRPTMADFKSSGSPAEDADVVIFPYFHNYYVNKTLVQGSWELAIAKQRNGPTGMVKAWADFALMQFQERES